MDFRETDAHLSVILVAFLTIVSILIGCICKRCKRRSFQYNTIASSDQSSSSQPTNRYYTNRYSAQSCIRDYKVRNDNIRSSRESFPRLPTSHQIGIASINPTCSINRELGMVEGTSLSTHNFSSVPVANVEETRSFNHASVLISYPNHPVVKNMHTNSHNINGRNISIENSNGLKCALKYRKVNSIEPKNIKSKNKIKENRANSRKYPRYVRKDNIKKATEWSIYSNPNYVYHYTSIFSANSILQDNEIKTIEARVPIFGTGVFLTDLEPTATTQELLDNNYNGSYNHLDKTECAIALPRNQLKLKKLFDPMHPSRNVIRCDGPINLSYLNYYIILRNQ